MVWAEYCYNSTEHGNHTVACQYAVLRANRYNSCVSIICVTLLPQYIRNIPNSNNLDIEYFLIYDKHLFKCKCL